MTPRSPEQLAQLLDALAAQLPDCDGLVGIHTGGVWIAEALAQRTGLPVLGQLGVALHRDDFDTRGLAGSSSTQLGSLAKQRVVLVDDVLASGRTVRAALNELFEFGRPAQVWLAVAFEIDARELPIQADFCGERLPSPNPKRYKVRPDPLRLELCD